MKNNDQTATTTAKPKRNKYTSQFKEQALECKTACKTFQVPGEKSVEKFPPQVVH